MSLKVPRHQEVVAEAMQVLWNNLPPSKMALIISMWFVEGGDYLKMREELFAGETVASLASKIQEFSEHQANQ